MDMSDVDLQQLVKQCQASIRCLVDNSRNGSDDRPPAFVSIKEINQVQERFNQWAGNLGALHPSTSPLSLGHRLRNSPAIRDGIVKQLVDLGESCDAANEICAGRRPNRTASPLVITSADLAEYDISSSDSNSSMSVASFSEDELDIQHQRSEIEELVIAIKRCIDNLFKASVFIRNLAPKARRQRAFDTKPFNSGPDIMYIQERYPSVDINLAKRLGEANARRRQYFKYRRDHHERLSTVNNDEQQLDQELQGTRPSKPETNFTNQRSSVLQTVTQPTIMAATEATDLMNLSATETQFNAFLQVDRPSAMSVTSFATSVVEMTDDALAFPPIPAEANHNTTILCPYCLTVVSLSGSEALRTKLWRKHVIEDLEPYVCSFSTCSLDSYHSQRAWFEHELLAHRHQWICPKCSEPYEDPRTLEHHINANHSQEFTAPQVQSVVELSKRPVNYIRPEDCPLCDDDWASLEPAARTSLVEGDLVVNTDQFRRHLGHHLQQIALFSLPRLEGDGHDRGSNNAALTRSLGRGGSDVFDSSGRHYRWVREDCGRGWAAVSSRRAHFIAFAAFLTLYKKHRQILHVPQVVHQSIQKAIYFNAESEVPKEFKTTGYNWEVLYNPSVPRSVEIELLHSIPYVPEVRKMVFGNPNNRLVVVCGDSVRLLDIPDQGGPVLDAGMVSLGRTPSFATMDSSGTSIGYCDSRDYPSWVIMIQDLYTGQIRSKIGPLQDVRSICLSADSRLLSASTSDKVMLCNIEAEPATNLITLSTRSSEKVSLGISRDHRFLAAGSRNGTVSVWDKEGHTVFHTDADNSHKYSVRSVTFDSDGRYLLTASCDYTVKLFCLETRRCLRTFRGHTNEVNCAIFAQKGKLVVSASADKSVMAWDTDTGSAILALKAHEGQVGSLVFDERGDMLATWGSDSKVRIWSFKVVAQE